MTNFMLCIFYPLPIPSYPTHKLLNLLARLREYKSKKLLKIGARGLMERTMLQFPRCRGEGMDGCREPAAHPKSRECGLKDTSLAVCLVLSSAGEPGGLVPNTCLGNLDGETQGGQLLWWLSVLQGPELALFVWLYKGTVSCIPDKD